MPLLSVRAFPRHQQQSKARELSILQARSTREIFNFSGKQDPQLATVGLADGSITGLLAALSEPHFLRAQRARGSLTSFSALLLRRFRSMTHDFKTCWDNKDVSRRVLAVAFE